MASISEILVQDDFGRIVSDLCVDTIEIVSHGNI